MGVLSPKRNSHIIKDLRDKGFSYQEVFEFAVIKDLEVIVRYLLMFKRNKIKDIRGTNDYLLKQSYEQNKNIYNLLINELHKMGGKAVKDVRPLEWDEVKPTYEWVEQNILPLIFIDKSEAIPIGSFGKKPKGEKSGDIDVAIDAKRYLDNGMQFEEVCEAINQILNEEHGLETTLLKGFDQVSVKVPICGDESKGYAQVDLMPSPDLKWAKFMYHSPNLAEQESKYKGAARNALLMALISESTKEITKLFEGKAEEYASLAIRFPTGVWNIKRSFMGKKGKLVQTGTVLESEFITRDPQDVIDIALGEGFKPDSANSFETLWEIIHRKDFIHKSRLNEIMTKFKVNLKSMKQDIPTETAEKYPFLVEDISNVLKPKSEEDIFKEANDYLEKEDLRLYELEKLHNSGVLKILPKEKVRQAIIDTTGRETKNRWRSTNLIQSNNNWMLTYISRDEFQKILDEAKYDELMVKYGHLPYVLPKYTGKGPKELRQLEKEFKFLHDKNFFEEIIKLLYYNLSHKSILRIVHERIKRNQFVFFVKAINYIDDHKNSHYPPGHVKKVLRLLDGSESQMERSAFRVARGNQFGLKFINDLINDGILILYKEGNKQILKANPNYKDSETFVSENYYKFLKYLTSNIEKYNLTKLNESNEIPIIK